MGNKKKYQCDEIKNVIIYDERNIIFILCGQELRKRRIIGVSADGTVRFKTHAQQGWIFSHLTKHPTAKMAVVCGSNEKVDGWYDWQFSIDPDTGSLSKHCPAY
jgi:hypothetical protein